MSVRVCVCDACLCDCERVCVHSAAEAGGRHFKQEQGGHKVSVWVFVIERKCAFIQRHYDHCASVPCSTSGHKLDLFDDADLMRLGSVCSHALVTCFTICASASTSLYHSQHIALSFTISVPIHYMQAQAHPALGGSLVVSGHTVSLALL